MEHVYRHLAHLGGRPSRLRLPGLALGCWGGLLLSSCVATTGDLDRIHTRIEAVESAVESGNCAEVQAALARTKAEVASVAREVESRPGVWSRFALEVILAAVGVAVPSAVGATNLVRNRARVKRGEPVKVPSAPVKGKAS